MKRLAVLTSGGDSPGMNAAIRAVVRAGVYHGVEVLGVYRGYQGLIEGDFVELEVRSVAKILGRGGTILKSARCSEFRTVEGRAKAAKRLKDRGVDGLVVIGGDGTFTGAKLLSEEHGIQVIGVPGTIDNDLGGTDFTIGFDTAINTVVEAVDKIRDTANSHNRLFFVEVMGRDSGFIALNAGIATGAIAIMTPETKLTAVDLVETLNKAETNRKTSSIVIVAEECEFGGAYELSKQVEGLTDKYEARITVLGHIQRGGSPSCLDRVLASRLGVEAVESLMNGRESCMVGVVDNKVVHTEFDRALNNKIDTLKDEVRLAQILSI